MRVIASASIRWKLKLSPHPVIRRTASAYAYSRAADRWHYFLGTHFSLPQLLQQIGRLSRTAPLTILCGTGYRSSIAASLLESEGFERLSNVMGGMHAVRHAKRPRLPAIERAESALTWEI